MTVLPIATVGDPVLREPARELSSEELRLQINGLGGPRRKLPDCRVHELFAVGLVWRPGARDLLASVRAAGVPTALVTSTGRRLVG